MSSLYGDDDAVQSSVAISKYYLNPETPLESYNNVQRQTLHSEENYLNFLDTGVEKTWFTLQPNVEDFIVPKEWNSVHFFIFQMSSE